MLIKPERPTLSALALSADDENDGFVTALDVFQLTIPVAYSVPRITICWCSNDRSMLVFEDMNVVWRLAGKWPALKMT